MTTEQIRTQLEKRYTHVTFVKTIQGLKGRTFTEWLVGEEGTRIFVHSTWKLEDILHNLELDKLYSQMPQTPSFAKWNVFKRAVLKGLIPATQSAYKRHTLDNLHYLLRGAK